MLDLRDLGLEGIERLCQVDLALKLVPLYGCPGRRRKSVCSPCLLSTGVIGTFVVQWFSVNKNSHQ